MTRRTRPRNEFTLWYYLSGNNMISGMIHLALIAVGGCALFLMLLIFLGQV